jgi:signal transduction histidine kinase
LRAILGFSNKLLEFHSKQLDPEGLRLINVLCENAAKMSDLINDLLELSRTGRKKIHPQKIYLNDIARSVYNELTYQVENRKIKFQVDDLPSTVGDRRLIRQVIINLLSNSLKFTQTKPVSKIRLGCHQKDGDTVYFIKDNGVGFDMKYADKLFDVFHRLHHDKDFEGTGVGLAIVHRIISMHGGKVWAESKPDKGATFYFTLPEYKNRKTSS